MRSNHPSAHATSRAPLARFALVLACALCVALFASIPRAIAQDEEDVHDAYDAQQERFQALVDAATEAADVALAEIDDAALDISPMEEAILAVSDDLQFLCSDVDFDKVAIDDFAEEVRYAFGESYYEFDSECLVQLTAIQELIESVFAPDIEAANASDDLDRASALETLRDAEQCAAVSEINTHVSAAFLETSQALTRLAPQLAEQRMTLLRLETAAAEVLIRVRAQVDVVSEYLFALQQALRDRVVQTSGERAIALARWAVAHQAGRQAGDRDALAALTSELDALEESVPDYAAIVQDEELQTAMNEAQTSIAELTARAEEIEGARASLQERFDALLDEAYSIVDTFATIYSRHLEAVQAFQAEWQARADAATPNDNDDNDDNDDE